MSPRTVYTHVHARTHTHVFLHLPYSPCSRCCRHPFTPLHIMWSHFICDVHQSDLATCRIHLCFKLHVCGPIFCLILPLTPPQTIITLDFLPFTFNLLTNKLILHSTNFLLSSSLVIAKDKVISMQKLLGNCTSHLLCLSPIRLWNMVANSKGLDTHPWSIPPFTSNVLLSPATILNMDWFSSTVCAMPWLTACTGHSPHPMSSRTRPTWPHLFISLGNIPNAFSGCPQHWTILQITR